MVKAWFVVVLGALLGAGFGCSDDETESAGGGAAGKAGAGTGGVAGVAGSSGAAGSGGSSGTGAAAGSAGSDSGIDAALLLVAGTDYTSTTEVTPIDLGTATKRASLTLADGDAVPIASGGRGFVLERSADIVLALGPDGAIDKSIPVGGADGGPVANPTGIAATATSAYVTLYNASKIAVLDLAQGAVTKSIDLSAYLDAADADGSVEASNPIYDPTSGRVYVTLGRIDLTTAQTPPFELKCPSVPALMLAFDAATGDAVDLNGAAAGNAVELLLRNPIDVAFDALGSRLLVLAAGCFAPSDGGTARTGHGVEAFDLGSSQSSVLLVPTDASFFSRILYLGNDSALIDRYDESFAEHWNRWTTTQSTLGPELSGVPAAPTYDRKGALLGVELTTQDGGSSAKVVRYDLTTESASVVVPDPWQTSFSASSGTALVVP